MERIRALVAGVLVVAGIFGTVMAMRIASRAMWAATRLLETLGVLVLALAAGWVVYRALVGESYDPRVIEEFETGDIGEFESEEDAEFEPEDVEEFESETTDAEDAS